MTTELRDRHGRIWIRDDAFVDLWYLRADEDNTASIGELVATLAPLDAVWHRELPPVGPYPSPSPGVCGRCGNTGQVHGPGGNGDWTDRPCDCMTPLCAACTDPWPCYGANDDDHQERS